MPIGQLDTLEFAATTSEVETDIGYATEAEVINDSTSIAIFVGFNSSATLRILPGESLKVRTKFNKFTVRSNSGTVSGRLIYGVG